jgi:serine/threonine protein kinase/Flp pilus assembly protein TadD
MSAMPSSVEEAVEQFIEARRRGEAIDAREFARMHAGLEPELSHALETWLALDRAASADRLNATANALDESIPERIGEYRIVREIGRGGMGVVLEALEEKLGRRVALKILPPELLANASARARFRREAELAARLDHSGIATVYGAGVEADRPWMAMRFVEGETLAHMIARARDESRSSVTFARAGARGRDAALSVAACLAQVARALAFAHERGVVHRDVKPSNIVVAPDGTPVLLDFGLAIAEEPEGRTLTRTGETAGTPAYIAPEYASGEVSKPDAQSDVYALGVTLFECLSLRRPFEGPTPIALYRAIVAGIAPSLRALNPSVPRDLAVVVATAMERERSRRYRSAAALADDLAACIGGRPIAARPVPITGRILRWARREPKQAVLASLLTCATLTAAVLTGIWWSARDEVRAAANLTSADEFEKSLSSGYGNLATNWLDDSDQSFARCLEIRPGDPEAIAGRALVRMKRHRDAEAVAVLADAPPTPAFSALKKLAAGELPDVVEDGEWFATASAVEMFIDGMRLSKQIERTPRHERAHLAALALARFDEAVKRSRSARFLYHVQRAQAAGAAGDEDAIRSAAASLVVLWPEHERALFTAGTALYKVDPSASIPLLEKATRLEPGWGAPNQILGNALYAVKDFIGADRALRRAIALDPHDADAYNSLGATLVEEHCEDDARGAYVAALAMRPMFETWANLGILDAGRDDRASAEVELRTALGFAPRDPLLRLTLAQVLARDGDTHAALSEVETALGFDPKNAAAWALYSEFANTLGEPSRAMLAAEAGLEIAPNDPDLERARDAADRALASGR